MSNPLVIFHSINGTMHCDDGFGAAWVAHKAMPTAEFYPGVYGQAPPFGKAYRRPVYMLDFSYKRAEMLRLGHDAGAFVVIDHHKTALAELDGLAEELMKDGWPYDGMGQYLNCPYILFDMDHSGAVLAWQHFFRNGGFGPMPDLLARIEDGDLWRFALSDSKFVQAALRSYPHDFETWDALMARPIAELAAEGVAIRRFIDAKIRETMPNARTATIAGHQVEVVNCPMFMVSDAANALAEKGAGPFGAAYVDGSNQRTWSLRSIGDFDVSDIAKKFGGGGHRNAAGFQAPLA